MICTRGSILFVALLAVICCCVLPNRDCRAVNEGGPPVSVTADSVGGGEGVSEGTREGWMEGEEEDPSQPFL